MIFDGAIEDGEWVTHLPASNVQSYMEQLYDLTFELFDEIRVIFDCAIEDGKWVIHLPWLITSTVIHGTIL